MLGRKIAAIAGCALFLAGCWEGGKPPWWPKPTPIGAARCAESAADQPDAQHLEVIAQIDADDGHVKQTTLLDPRDPKATPMTPELARVGGCYSGANDLDPGAKGAVIVQDRKSVV